MKKIFCSLPMSGKERSQIMENVLKTAEIYMKGHPDEEPGATLFVNNFANEQNEVPPKKVKYPAVWYLGKALELLSECDEAVFSEDSTDSRGCKMEDYICEVYGIPRTRRVFRNRCKLDDTSLKELCEELKITPVFDDQMVSHEKHN